MIETVLKKFHFSHSFILIGICRFYILLKLCFNDWNDAVRVGRERNQGKEGQSEKMG